jgi:hypothetical protein
MISRLPEGKLRDVIPQVITRAGSRKVPRQDDQCFLNNNFGEAPCSKVIAILSYSSSQSLILNAH